MRKILLMAVLVRVLAAGILILSPAFDTSDELDGWDVARFQEISDAPGAPYVDHDVEYPPGSVALIQAVSAFDDGENRRVTTHRVLAGASLLVDLSLALLLGRRWSQNAATAYLVLGSPLVFFGLVRFDLWACLLAVLAVSAASSTNPPRRVQTTLGAAALVAGAMIKLWPALLLLPLLALGKRSLVAAAGAGGAVLGVAWLAISGTDALTQVLTLRGATGWQIESVGGSLTALFSDADVRLEANAYRIGSMNSTIVLVGRACVVGVAVSLSWMASRLSNHDSPDSVSLDRDSLDRDSLDRVALVMLGSVAALLVTAPLLSPQFLLWLSPWAAMLVGPDFLSQIKARSATPATQAVLATALAITLTAAILVIVGPPNLYRAPAAVALLTRDALLITIIGCSFAALRRPEFPLRANSASPRPARSQTKVQ